MPTQQRQDGNKTQERQPPTPGKPRPDHQTHQRPQQEPRRKRGDQRPAAWGDGVDRAWCARALSFLPETFPVESHAGAATITPTVVDRRDQMTLLCDFSHSGEHQWPALAILISGGDGVPHAEDEGV